MKRKPGLKREVKNLMTGEAASAIGFILVWLYGIWRIESAAPYLVKLSMVLPFAGICIILFTGSYFWYLMYNSVKEKRKFTFNHHDARVFNILYIINTLLVIIATVYNILFFSQLESKGEAFFMLALVIFMWLEYINYFYIRLSYLTPREFKDLVTHRKLRRSHLSRMRHEYKMKGTINE